MTSTDLDAFMTRRGWTAKHIVSLLPPGFVTASHIRMCRRGKRNLSPALATVISNLPKNARPAKSPR